MFCPRRFARNLVLLSLALMMFQSTGWVDGAGAVLNFLPVSVAACLEGRSHAALSRQPVPAGQIWRISRIMAEIYLTVSIVSVLLLAVLVPPLRAVLGSIDIALLLAIFGLFTFIAFAAIRWSYDLGVRLELASQGRNTG